MIHICLPINKKFIMIIVMVCFLLNTKGVFAATNEVHNRIPNEAITSDVSSSISIKDSKVTLDGISDIKQKYVDNQKMRELHAFVPLARVVIAENGGITESEFLQMVPESKERIVNTRILAKQVNAVNDKRKNIIYCKYELLDAGDYILLVSCENAINNRLEKFMANRLIIERKGEIKSEDKELNRIEDKYSYREVDIADLHDAVKEVTRYYREHDYPAATAYLPSQNSENGDVHIGVEQGRYGAINIKNQSKLQTSIIEGLTKGLKTGNELRGRELETAIYNINSSGGIKAAGIMKAGNSQGETDLTI